MKLARSRRLLVLRRILFATAIVLAADNCSLNVDVGGPTAIIKGNGDKQTAPVNTQLTEALTVLVANQFGQPLEDIVVNWSILAGGGSLSSPTSQTDAGGVASVNYTTGPTAGTATIQARVSGVPAVVFSITVT